MCYFERITLEKYTCII